MLVFVLLELHETILINIFNKLINITLSIYYLNYFIRQLLHTYNYTKAL